MTHSNQNFKAHIFQQISEALKTHHQSIFKKSIVIVPDYSWIEKIKFGVIQQHSILGNIEFFTWNQWKSLIFDITKKNKTSAIVKINQWQASWQIFKLLDELKTSDKFKNVTNYYSNDLQKHYELSFALSKQFFTYGNHNPEIIDYLLEKKELQENDGIDLDTFNLQQYILKKLLKNLNESSILDANYWVIQHSKEAIVNHEDSVLSQYYNQFIGIGLNLQSQDFNDLFLSIKEATILQCTLIDFPVFRYNEDDLLAKYLCSLYPKQKISHSVHELRFTSTQLGKIQQSLVDKNTLVKPLNKTDKSFQVHSNYTKYREVETAYQYVLQLLENEKDLSFQDICFTASNIEDYAPAIKAVFENQSKKIKTRITTQSIVDENTEKRAFLRLLSIDYEKWKVSDVLDLLNFDCIRSKFNLDKDYAFYEQIIKTARIKRGLEEDGASELRWVTWQHGFESLIIGLCLPDEELEYAFEWNNDHLYPITTYEGSDTESILKLYHFYLELKETFSQISTPKSTHEWSLFLEKVIERFIHNDQHYDPQLNQITNYLFGDKETYTASIEIDYTILLSHVKSALKESIFKKEDEQGIQFIPLSQMKFYSFKYVGIFGFNSIISTSTYEELDLRQYFKQLTQPIDYEKFSVWQTLLQTSNAIWISYLGRSVSDNTEIPKTFILESLIEKARLTQNFKIIEHPLHFNSPLYNVENEDLFRYENVTSNKTPLIDQKDNQKLTNEEEIKEVVLKDMISFYKSPYKYYYNKKLGIYEQGTTESIDHEVYQLDSLQKYVSFNYAKNKVLNNQKVTKKELSQLQLLSFYQQGTAEYENLLIEGDSLVSLRKKIEEGLKEEKLAVHLKLKDYVLQADLSGKIGDEIWFFVGLKSDKLKSHKKEFEAIMNYFAWQLAYPEEELKLVLFSAKDRKELQLTKDECRTGVIDFLTFYLKHKDDVFDFFHIDEKNILDLDKNKNILELKNKPYSKLYLSTEEEIILNKRIEKIGNNPLSQKIIDNHELILSLLNKIKSNK